MKILRRTPHSLRAFYLALTLLFTHHHHVDRDDHAPRTRRHHANIGRSHA